MPGFEEQLRRLRERIGGLGVWRARGLAFALGALAVFAMPPVYQIYVLVPALSGLLWLTVAQTSRWRAFAIGWAFGAGFFAAGLYWVSFALLVDAEKFAWLVPFAIFGFAFGLGLFSALAALAAYLTPGGLAARALSLAGAWTVLEWLRTWIFTGFPWNPVGSVWLFSDTLAQGVAVAGTLGMSFLGVLAAAAPGALADKARAPRLLALFVLAALAAVGVGGAHRLANATDEVVRDVRLRLVQPNIPQALKWRPELREQHMLTLLDLSHAMPLPGDPPPTHIFWAETAVPFFIETHAPWMRLVGAAAPQRGLVITGAPRLVSREGDVFQVANSLLAIGGDGDVQAVYDKFHLVPFGEYVPLADWLPLEKIAQGGGAFTPGPGPVTLKMRGLPPASPLICYEIIFPGQVTDGTGSARWLLNLTNDGWYRKTAGPHQHFVSARLRALEEGLPVVRVAGTGISGIIDAYGRVRQKLSLGEKGFIDGDLPVPAKRPSVYSRVGDGPALALALLALGAGPLCARWRRNRNHP